MWTKTTVAVFTLAAMLIPVTSAPAQQTEGSKRASEAEKAQSAYRLDFTLGELEDGKKINTRQYSMHAQPRDWSEIKIGSRVPVVTKGDDGAVSQWQYLDVGTNIRCRLVDQADAASLGGNVSLAVNADLSNFAIPDQQGQSMHPTIRQLRIEASTVATLGKPVVVGVVDDPNSKRQYQLEVTVTKLR